MSNTTISDGPFRVTVVSDIEYVRITTPGGEIDFGSDQLPRLTKLLQQAQASIEDPCPYTYSHTRHWCGHAGCRDS